jgi:UDP-N-acetylmuramyl tripeptide synthase
MSTTPLTLLRDTDAAVAWLRAHGATGLATDSRRVRPGDAFIAWPGYGVDARQFVPAALGAGAVACLVNPTARRASRSTAPPAPRSTTSRRPRARWRMPSRATRPVASRWWP